MIQDPEFAGVSQPAGCCSSFLSGHHIRRICEQGIIYLRFWEKMLQEEDLEYMSLEKQVTEDTPPCFPLADCDRQKCSGGEQLPFAEALRKMPAFHMHIIYFPTGSMECRSPARNGWKENTEIPIHWNRSKSWRLLSEKERQDYPPEKADEILREFGLDGNRPRTSGRRKKRNGFEASCRKSGYGLNWRRNGWKENGQDSEIYSGGQRSNACQKSK